MASTARVDNQQPVKGFLAEIVHKFSNYMWNETPPIGTPVERHRREELSAWLDYRSYDDERGVYLRANSAAMLIELTPLLGGDESTARILAEICTSSVPPESICAMATHASSKIGVITDPWVKARAQGGEFYQALAEHRRRYFRRAVWTSASRSAPFFFRHFRVYMSVEKAGFPDDALLADLAQLRDGVVNNFMSLGVVSEVLTPEALINILADVLNPTRGVRPSQIQYDSNHYIGRQIIRTDTRFTVYRDRIVTQAKRLGDKVFGEDYEREFGAKEDTFDIRCFSVRRFPDESSQSRMARTIGDLLNSQLRLEGATISCLVFMPETVAATKSKTEFKRMRSDQALASPFTKAFPSVRRKAEDWAAVAEEVSEGGVLCSVGYFVVSIAPYGDGDRAERRLQAVYRAAGFGLERDDDCHLVTLLGALPLGMSPERAKDFKTFARFRTMTTGSVSRLAPLQGEFLGYQIPHLLLVGRRGQPFYFSLFSNMGEGNHNCALIGGSGSGKSVLLQELATAMRGAGGMVFVIDSGESFKSSCELQGGVYIKFSLETAICLNPFSMADGDLARSDAEYEAETKQTIGQLVMCMARNDVMPTQEEKGIIDRAVNLVWERKGTAGCITDVADLLAGKWSYFGSPEERAEAEARAARAGKPLIDPNEQSVRIDADGEAFFDFGVRARDLALSLMPFTVHGTYGAFFDGPSTLVIDNPYTGFEMGPLDSKPELRSVVVLLVMFQIRQRMREGGRTVKKLLIIDEAWQLLGGGAAGEFIQGFARRCRKEGGALATGTQGIDDYYKSDGARACLENSDWSIVMRLKPVALAQAVKSERLALDLAGRQLIESLRTSAREYSELFIQGPNGRAVGRLVLDPFSAALYSSSADDFEHIKGLRAKGVSLQDAVYSLAFPNGEPPDDDVYDLPVENWTEEEEDYVP